MTEQGMMVREVEGWHLASRDGAAWWVRDLELAERAGLADPHKIRETIRAVESDLGQIQDPASERILILSQNTLVPMPGGRGHRAVVEYLLNREAALHVIMRLRTERAVALQVALVRVFLAVVDGNAAEELRGIRQNGTIVDAELELMKHELVKLRAELSEQRAVLMLGAGVLTGPQVRVIKSMKRRIVEGWVRYGLARTLRSAHASVQNALRTALDWGNAGQRAELMPVAMYSRALAWLEAEEKKLELYRRAAQLTLLGPKVHGEPQ